MESFSYKDYIKCIHTMRLNAVMRLAEEGETYKKSREKSNYDNKIKEALKSTEDIVYLINTYLNPVEKIKIEDFEICSEAYKNKLYKDNQVEAVFKWNKKQIYFFIYYEEKINQKIFYKILNYCIDFMQDWLRNKKHENKTYPLLVPIIIYTGKEKWKEKRETNKFYNLIDINRITDRDLIASNRLLEYIMFIEKSKDKRDLKRRIKILIQAIENQEIKKKINEIIEEMLNEKLVKNQEKNRLQNLKIKEGEYIMSALIERLVKEDEELVAESSEKTINQIVKNMLTKGLKIETIEKITKQSIRNIYIIKKEMEKNKEI